MKTETVNRGSLHAVVRRWFVHATACHRSRVGPFATAALAAKFAEEERRPEDGWRRVSITARTQAPNAELTGASAALASGRAHGLPPAGDSQMPPEPK